MWGAGLRRWGTSMLKLSFVLVAIALTASACVTGGRGYQGSNRGSGSFTFSGEGGYSGSSSGDYRRYRTDRDR